jgi:hypothetical protein
VTDIDSASNGPEDPSPRGAVAVPQAPSPEATTSTTSTTSTAGGVTFDFTFNGNSYTCNVNAPDQYGQYGFTITQGTNTIASLIYKDDNDWSITVGLPSALQVDTNLTINQLDVNIAKGSVTKPAQT